MSRPVIQYEFESRPDTGLTMPIDANLLWLRMPLPFMLNHINLWLLEDDIGWVVVDTGICTDVSREVWQKTFADAMRGRPVTHVVATHLHPDHVGCAGWLTRKFDVDLWMTREEYLLCRVLVADTGREAPEEGVRFYKAAGFSQQDVARYVARFGGFGKYVSALPESHKRLKDGDTIRLADGDWQVIIGRGHSPEHASLYNESHNMLISGDQLLPTISSNVSVFPTEPGANPLRDWLDSLSDMKSRLPDDVLVLPAHGRPFRGAQQRLQALIDEHMQGLDALLDYCDEPRRAVDVFPALFKGRITDGNLILATGESIAHLNFLLADGSLVAESDGDGVIWYRRA